MQNTTLFQLVLCVVQACSGLDSLVFAYVMLVVWLCFKYTTIEASMRRNGEIRREKRRNKQVLKFQLQGDGRHTLWRVDRHPSTQPTRHQHLGPSAPVTCRPSHPVTPVTGPGESVSPTIQSSFAQFLSHFLHLQCTIRTRLRACLAYK